MDISENIKMIEKKEKFSVLHTPTMDPRINKSLWLGQEKKQPLLIFSFTIFC
jgi:hypothetical protein